MTELTKAEEEIMQVLWQLEKAFVKEIIVELPEPKPAYNTVSTIVRILEKKQFVGYTAFGKTHQYFPLVKKEKYLEQTVAKMQDNYFGGSVKQMLSFFMKKEKLTTKELDEILKTIDQNQQS